MRIPIIFSTMLILGSSAVCFAQGPRTSSPTVKKLPASLRMGIKQIAAKALPSVVQIVCDNGKDKVQGSGFFIDDGIVITNYHVIRSMKRGVVTLAADKKNQKRIFRIARIIGFDEAADIAVLSIPSARGSGVPSLPLAPPSGVLEVGEVVFALGNPEGLAGTFSPGIVSASVRFEGKKARIQITAPISSGSSGGPLVNEFGQAVGVVAASISDGQNLNFAIPMSLVAPVLKEVKFPTNVQNFTDATDEMVGGIPRDWIWADSKSVVTMVTPTPAPTPTPTPKPECTPAPTPYRTLVVGGEQSLRGLKGMMIIVEELHPASRRLLNEDSIKSRIGLQLRRNGVKVVETVDAMIREPASPYLYLNLNCLDINVGYSCSADLELNQNVGSEVTDIKFKAVTWSRSWTIFARYSDVASFIPQKIDELTTSFLDDYWKVNTR